MIKVYYQGSGWPSIFLWLNREVILQGCLKVECMSGVWLMLFSFFFFLFLLFLRIFGAWESACAASGSMHLVNKTPDSHSLDTNSYLTQ